MDVVRKDSKEGVLLCDVSFYPSQCQRLQFVSCPEFVNGSQYSIQYRVSTRRHEAVTLYLDIQLIFPCSQYINVESRFSLVLCSADPKHPETFHKEERTFIYSFRLHLCHFVVPLATISESTHVQCILRTLSSKVLPLEWQLSREPTENPIGIINPGSTCYLNSVVQALYNLIPFRSLIQSIDFFSSLHNASSYGDVEKILQSTLFALQRTFFALEHCRSAVDLMCLFQSFHWKDEEIFEQRDAHEVLLFLIDRISEEWKSLQLPSFSDDNPIDALFKGEFLVSIGEKNGSFSSSHKDPFYVIPLSVDNCTDLQDAFQLFLKREELDPENKIRLENGQSVEGWKEVKISGIPEILIIQLKRFSFDPVYFEVNKIDSYFAFPEVLDVPSSNENISLSLKSVVVHSGTPQLGHYFSFARQSEQWIRFDDDQVSTVSTNDMQQSAFGVSQESLCPRYSSRAKSLSGPMGKEPSSAYLLFYSRERSQLDLPRKDGFLRDLITKEMKSNVDQFYDCQGITVHVVTLDSLNQSEMSQYSLYWDFVTPSARISFHIWARQSLYDLLPRFEEEVGIPVTDQTWWWMHRRHSVWRVNERISMEVMHQWADQLCDSYEDKEIVLYVQNGTPVPSSILLFVGRFEKNQSIVWEEIWVREEATIEALSSQWGGSNEIWWMENHSLQRILQGSRETSVSELGLENGDILFITDPINAPQLVLMYSHPFTVFCFPLSKYHRDRSFVLSVNGVEQISSLKKRITEHLQQFQSNPEYGTGDYQYISVVPKSWKDIRIFRFTKPSNDEKQPTIWRLYMEFLMDNENLLRNEWITSISNEKRGTGETFDYQCGDEVEDEEACELVLPWGPIKSSPPTSDLFLYYDVIPEREYFSEILYVNLVTDHDYQEVIVQLLDDCTCEELIKEIRKLPKWSGKEVYCYCVEEGHVTCYHTSADIPRYGCVVQHRSCLCVCERRCCKEEEVECEVAVLRGWCHGRPVYSRDHIPRVIPIYVGGTYQDIVDRLLHVFGEKEGCDLYYLESGEDRNVSVDRWIHIKRFDQQIRENPCDEKLFDSQDDNLSLFVIQLHI